MAQKASKSQINGGNITWATPTLSAGWGSFDTGAIPTTDSADTWRYPRYHKDALGYVHLMGLARNNSGGTNNGSTNTTIFTLPAGFRPAHTILMSTFGNDTACRVDVGVDGRVKVVSTIPNTSWVSLTPISFLAEQ